MAVDPLIQRLKGTLIVSCQAYPGEPLRHPETMAQMARAAELGGASAIRCQGLADIAAIKGRVDIPVFGLWKEGHEGVYITPTLRHARACISAGADVVALDATARPRPDGRTFEETVEALRGETLIMADCACMDDVKRALACGVDIVSTTLAGYTNDRPKTEGPDLEFLREAVAAAGEVPVFCEGRIHNLADARAAMDAGAFAIVVGTAITHPTSITSWFAGAIG
ncbi:MULTISPECIES: N-acetylmannosamine-6-phosphate 2-epimerase [Gordonibacter]|uniref:Putative N-acetylmannosamine-6-phosphate 2-epimerase n=1 Tax=Gordonibacter faecis TaxID=3047475 RepID=A0ABT7DN07_9ACTN|nr:MULTISPECIES: N-acetylmannosamine-6-phosphate 2-epimerase [unclassified Gordonibacter]MDJ1650922.1 N-acetylmannosamine-6-phosphate 2-epimerase [Gordonibacter sp. KGMB12511]HIW76602.1 N-acetylmannosamine-6-phosphate 2-epimerase [Candidatus Gordonibacter avicola]